MNVKGRRGMTRDGLLPDEGDDGSLPELSAEHHIDHRSILVKLHSSWPLVKDAVALLDATPSVAM